jgi:ParB family chromosome partitioning protein
MSNSKHFSKHDSWETPDYIIDMARSVLGAIDLDPASSFQANQRVGATKFIGLPNDSLEMAWAIDKPVSIYLNPPGGKAGNKSKTGLFWKKLIDLRDTGKLKHAIFMSFSIEALQHTQLLPVDSLCYFPLCIPRRRLVFIDPTGCNRASPTHASAIAYVPGTLNNSKTFREVFSEIGAILN